MVNTSLKQVHIDDVALSDLRQLAIGAFAPLKGFMEEADYDSVCDHMRLRDGSPWPIPVTLPTSSDIAATLHLDERIALMGPDGRMHGTLTVTSIYKPDLEREAHRVYRTNDLRHPGVKRLLQRGDVYLGGPVELLVPDDDPLFAPYLFTPEQTRAEFARRGWKTVVGFQTRNPVHRAHEYIQKCALETVDGLYLNPLVGPTKQDDIPAPVRLKAYLAILEHYYPRDKVFFGVYKAAMRYAGPREAVMHALVRRNFGCTHFIVGRDHAGVGDYYGPYDAQHIFSEFAPGELGITPVFFENAFYCKACSGMATSKTCPHGDDQRIILSGTRVRQMLSEGIAPPPEFSRPEVVKVLMEYYAQRT